MILGVFDLKNEAPKNAGLAESCGFGYAVAVNDGVYSLPSLVKTLNYILDEPDLHGQTPNRVVPPGTYTTIWGGSFGTGLWAWRNEAQYIGTEFYADWRRPCAWVMPLIKLIITALVWRGRPWVAVVNAYVPVDTRGGTAALTMMPAWALRRWQRLANVFGAFGLFVLGWAEANAAILAAWPPKEA